MGGAEEGLRLAMGRRIGAAGNTRREKCGGGGDGFPYLRPLRVSSIFPTTTTRRYSAPVPRAPQRPSDSPAPLTARDNQTPISSPALDCETQASLAGFDVQPSCSMLPPELSPDIAEGSTPRHRHPSGRHARTQAMIPDPSQIDDRKSQKYQITTQQARAYHDHTQSITRDTLW